MEEKVVLVDEYDREVGTEEKLAAHEENLLHRAISIFVFNTKGELLLQKRADTKYHSGGLWANTCCTHPRPGESLDDAVHRRLKEEMGFDCPLEPVGTFYYQTTFDNGLHEHEFDHVFKGVYEGEVDPNPEEASDYKWVAWGDVVADVKNNPGIYAVWLGGIIEALGEKLKP